MATKEFIVFTKKGQALRAKIDDLPLQSRRGMGVGVIMVKEGDEVVAAIPVEREPIAGVNQ